MLGGLIDLDKTIYFDNAATTFPKPEQVYTFMDKFYREYGVNVGRGQYKLAFAANMLVSETRKLLIEIFHCPNKKVVFTHSATEALNIVLQGTIGDNFNVYMSPFEHNAVTRVIYNIETSRKLNIHKLAVEKTALGYHYDLEAIKYQFTEFKPNIVIVSHASNVCGIVAPIEEICEMSKVYDAINVIDICQTAGLIDTDLSSNNIDYAIFAGHKTLYGPLGIAGIILGNGLRPLPLIYGGTGIDSANQYLPETVPERYEVGSPNISAIAGLNSSLKWIADIGIENIYAKEKENHRRLFEVLDSFTNIRIVGLTNTDRSIGIVSCVFNRYSSDNIGQILSEHNIAVRTGLHCAPDAHKFLDTFPAGTVRFSISYFTNEDDIAALKKALYFIEINS